MLCKDSDASLGGGWCSEPEKTEGQWVLGLGHDVHLYRTGNIKDLSKQDLGIYLSTEH